PARMRRHHGRHRVARPQAVVRRRHQLPRPGRPPRPPGPPGRGPGRPLRAPRRRPAPGARVQAVRAGLLPHRRARLGHRLRPLPVARAPAVGGRGHTPPRPPAPLPFQLFRVMYGGIRGGGFNPEAGVCFMLDQCHNVERKIPGQIRSVLNVQELTAKALLVDRDTLSAATGVLMDAFATDVRPLLADLRTSQGLDPDPMAAYDRSGYDERIVAERVGGAQAGWGAVGSGGGSPGPG